MGTLKRVTANWNEAVHLNQDMKQYDRMERQPVLNPMLRVRMVESWSSQYPAPSANSESKYVW